MNTLLKLADTLDSKGFFQEANILDKIILANLADIYWFSLKRDFMNKPESEHTLETLYTLNSKIKKINDKEDLKMLLKSLKFPTSQSYEKSLSNEDRKKWRTLLVNIQK